MECPEGLEGADRKEEVLELKKAIYGCVQAARLFWKLLIKVLKEKGGFNGGEVDPCLLMKKGESGIVFIGMYVDDCLLIGDKKAIEETIEIVKTEFTVKTEWNPADYLGCDLKYKSDGSGLCWLLQSDIMKGLEKNFGNEIKGLQEYDTAGTPRKGLSRDPEGVSISAEKHSKYRTGVGKLLYLVKHSRPDIANAVRELSKVLDGPTEAAYKEMLRITKYVLSTKDWGLKIFPSRPSSGSFELLAFSDSSYADDKETRLSVTGYILYLCGVPICWRSKSQKTVSLSSTEAEWIALSEAAKDVRFVVQLVESMGIEVKRPVKIRVDNVGAIFMSNNITTTGRTKHVDVRTKFVNQLVDDGELAIEFVRSEDNDSDGFTKNLIRELFKKHRGSYMGKVSGMSAA